MTPVPPASTSLYDTLESRESDNLQSSSNVQTDSGFYPQSHSSHFSTESSSPAFSNKSTSTVTDKRFHSSVDSFERMFTEIDRAITGLSEKEEAEKKEGDKPPPLPPRPHEYPQTLTKPPVPLPPQASYSPPSRSLPSPPPIPVEQYDPLAAAAKETARRQKYQMKRQQPDPTYDKLDTMPQYSSSSSEEDVRKEAVTTSAQLPAAEPPPRPPKLHDGLQRSGSSHEKLVVR